MLFNTHLKSRSSIFRLRRFGDTTSYRLFLYTIKGRRGYLTQPLHGLCGHLQCSKRGDKRLCHQTDESRRFFSNNIFIIYKLDSFLSKIVNVFNFWRIFFCSFEENNTIVTPSVCNLTYSEMLISSNMPFLRIHYNTELQ